jgi:hypothetical protein
MQPFEMLWLIDVTLVFPVGYSQEIATSYDPVARDPDVPAVAVRVE